MDIVNDGLEKQRAKRRRVARMKKMIIYTIISFMLITLCVMIFLVFEVISLQRQIDALSAKIAVSETVDDANEMVDDSFLDNLYLVDNMDNIAEEGDIPMVYLTFDDGPSDNTDAILDILDDYNVKATFFVVGKDLDTYGDAYRRIVNDGHTIGMHSYSHNYSKLYQSEDSFVADYNKIHDLIYDTTGVDTNFYRFPGGSSNKVSNTSMSVFINYLNSVGAVYYDWNIASGDATSQAFTADELVDNVMSDVVKYKTSVVLLHDASNKNATVEALPRLIESLNEAGAVILPITEDTEIIQHVSVVQ
ncbi:polysaccharide deacetylase family protein [Pseudobutyrivibrio xylanivorans]|uniref:Peptidoglycan/xylan/chitin deacetylase, PgdA/CDA1 family n=1 Tax=Pseudobutyrivibrio xylanivorans DSM 14809 TaxID=1123012 RepID=A0A1M6EGS2_PSEXY|nr:polysaccharide deacetylase family protein [Pseudobutyrivibrio xylanivorans]SHI84623.1 Peptidoglycan/xylan/chitin deacetylase, PgdA/CDA1 family [Pseudobutyrivibrio xylanivorans DSM 14809]